MGSLVALGCRLLGSLFPATPLEEITPASLAELAQRYRWRDRFVSWGVLLLAVALGVLYYYILKAAMKETVAAHADAAYLLHASVGQLRVLAGLLSIVSVLVVEVLILRLILGAQECRLYLTYVSHRANQTSPFDLLKSAIAWFAAGVLPLIAVIFLQVDKYTAFTDEAIIDNNFTSLGAEVERPYASVKAVYHVLMRYSRSGDEEEFAPCEVIVFDDGSRWESVRAHPEDIRSRHKMIGIYVAKKAGVMVREVNHIEEIPP
jgi:hypothetical protein